jgi:hypothetical protein
MIELGIAFVAGVVASESVRRLWKRYAVPKIAELKIKVAAALRLGRD